MHDEHAMARPAFFGSEAVAVAPAGGGGSAPVAIVLQLTAAAIAGHAAGCVAVAGVLRGGHAERAHTTYVGLGGNGFLARRPDWRLVSGTAAMRHPGADWPRMPWRKR